MTEPSRRFRPRGAEDHRGAATATTGSSTAPRRSSPTATRPTWSSSPPAPTRRKGAKGITPVHGRGRHGGLQPRPQARQGRPGGGRHRRAVLHRRAGARRQPASARRASGFIAMMQRLPQERVGAAVANTAHAKQILARDDRVRQGAQGVRPADRLLPAQQVQDRRAADQARGHPGLRRRLHRGARRAASSPRSTRPRPSGGPPRCRTTCSTSASSCTAATAS